MLAALRLLEIDPAAQPVGDVATLVMREGPSILTLTALTKLAAPERAAWLAPWRLAEQARWTLGLLAFAIGLSAAGLWLIQRVVKREQRLHAMTSDFVASVSHELRAPVASIRLMADALEAGNKLR